MYAGECDSGHNERERNKRPIERKREKVGKGDVRLRRGGGENNRWENLRGRALAAWHLNFSTRGEKGGNGHFSGKEIKMPFLVFPILRRGKKVKLWWERKPEIRQVKKTKVVSFYALVFKSLNPRITRSWLLCFNSTVPLTGGCAVPVQTKLYSSPKCWNSHLFFFFVPRGNFYSPLFSLRVNTLVVIMTTSTNNKTGFVRFLKK